jgi:hypothetical protein
VESGKVTRARAEQALGRVAALKSKYVGAPAAPSWTEAKALLRSAPHVSLVEKLASVAVDGSVRGESLVDLG